jgi:hypothetical protein
LQIHTSRSVPLLRLLPTDTPTLCLATPLPTRVMVMERKLDRVNSLSFSTFSRKSHLPRSKTVHPILGRTGSLDLTVLPSPKGRSSRSSFDGGLYQSALNSHSICLAGFGGYPAKIGNITCSVKLIQTAIFPLRYHSTTNIISAAQATLESSQAITFPTFLTYLLVGLGGVISEGQNFEAIPNFKFTSAPI